MISTGFGISVGYLADPRMRWYVAGGSNRVRGLARALENVPPRLYGGAWTPSRFEDDFRHVSRWLSACAVVTDIDYFDAAGQHVVPPHIDRPRHHLSALARSERLGIVHDTPRGMRAILVLEQDLTERDVMIRTTQGAAAWIQTLLERAGLGWATGSGVPGFAADRRIREAYYLNSCTVVDTVREAPLFVLREEPFTVDELLAHAGGAQ